MLRNLFEVQLCGRTNKSDFHNEQEWHANFCRTANVPSLIPGKSLENSISRRSFFYVTAVSDDVNDESFIANTTVTERGSDEQSHHFQSTADILGCSFASFGIASPTPTGTKFAIPVIKHVVKMHGDSLQLRDRGGRVTPTVNGFRTDVENRLR